LDTHRGDHRPPRRRQDLFKIVQHEQIVAVPQDSPENVKNRTAIGANTESGGNGGQDERWLLHIREIDKLSRVGSHGNRTDGGPCFANSTGSGQGDKPHIVTLQQRLDVPDLSFSPDKRRSR
jgi:hypothetical protein